MILDHKRQAPVKFQCGTPKEFCTGGIDSRFQTSGRLHSSVREAQLCFQKYLKAQGYVRTNANTWERPGEPIKVT